MRDGNTLAFQVMLRVNCLLYYFDDYIVVSQDLVVVVMVAWALQI